MRAPRMAESVGNTLCHRRRRDKTGTDDSCGSRNWAEEGPRPPSCRWIPRLEERTRDACKPWISKPEQSGACSGHEEKEDTSSRFRPASDMDGKGLYVAVHGYRGRPRTRDAAVNCLPPSPTP